MTTCVICGAPFAPRRPQQILCSPACAEARRAEQQRARHPGHAEARLERQAVQRARYHRLRAAYLAANPPPPTHCAVCGQAFTPRGPNARTCSAACGRENTRRQRNRWHRENHATERAKRAAGAGNARNARPVAVPNPPGSPRSAPAPPPAPVASAEVAETLRLFCGTCMNWMPHRQAGGAWQCEHATGAP